MSLDRDAIIIELSIMPAHREIARKILGNYPDAEDAVQSATQIAIKQLPAQENGPGHYVAWFRFVLRNECHKILRQRQRQPILEPDEMPRGSSPDWDQIIDVKLAAANLKPQERAALQALAAGFTYNEIQSLFDWTYTKVNRCISEGRQRMRTQMEAG